MHKIFIAHPDSKLVALYEPYLSRHFSVDSAHDGLTALRKIRLHKPALVLSDYNLPKLSGLSLLRFVRGHKDLAGIPFIFFVQGGDPTAALSLGASDWIQRFSATPDLLTEKIYYHLKINRPVVAHLI